jgi:hypothetical protein
LAKNRTNESVEAIILTPTLGVFELGIKKH